ncbi:MAG: glycine-rich protein [Vicingaceae bacterium]|nr:MAG: glycine-rich protein [Vicingaceae bacterium]
MKKLLSITAGVLSAFTVSAQCPQISCPSNITVNNAPGTCAAVVNYVTPVGTNPCGTDSSVFNYTGALQIFTVPNGVTSVTIKVWGAQGGTSANPNNGNGNGGLGGYAKGDLTVTPGQILNIYVGGGRHSIKSLSWRRWSRV